MYLVVSLSPLELRLQRLGVSRLQALDPLPTDLEGLQNGDPENCLEQEERDACHPFDDERHIVLLIGFIIRRVFSAKKKRARVSDGPSYQPSSGLCQMNQPLGLIP